jgi:ligand-binding sensor domain-containing protein
MTILRYILSLSILSVGFGLQAQTDLALGKWKSHLAYKEGLSITQSDDKIIYASSKGLFTIDKEDLSVKFLAPEDGLSGATIRQVAYDNAEKLLFIVYSDNNLDVVRNDEIINFPFIKSNTSIIGSKQINDIYFDNKGFSYLATDFAILIFNNKKLEFTTTTFTEQVKINTIAYAHNVLYVGADNGLYKVALDGSVNIADFKAWTKLTITGETQNTPIRNLASKHGQLFVSTDDDEVFSVGPDLGSYELVYAALPNETIRYLSDEGDDLMVGIEDNNNRSKTLFIGGDKVIKIGGADCINRTLYAIEDQKGRIWYADRWDPIRYTEDKTFGCKKLTFAGPFDNTAGEIAFKDNVAYVASLGITEDYQYANTNRGFYVYDDNNWTNYNRDNIPEMASKDFQNVQGIAVHPDSSIVYIGSYWNGVLKYNLDTKVSRHWNKNNSPLQGVVGDEARTRVPYLIFDDKNNLWVSNFGAPKPLVVKTSEDKWFSFNVPSDKSLGDITIDQFGNKWIAVVGAGNGLLVYNEGANIESTSDDKIRYINRTNSEITGNKVTSLITDLDGSVWIGTDAGPVVFDCPDPFNASTCKGNTRRVVVDGIPAPLLKAEDILSIAVDGANRKWFGTRNGIFVQGPDGTEEIAQYNVTNSPLLDNKVINLKYNPKSGEMFIVTPSGIQSIKTETTEGSKRHSSDVYAFPNPVRPDYTGPIAIKGLARDANVKITDINGRLVYETTALGGQAVWDGNDYNGVLASAGIYLVFSASTDISVDLDSFVTKILIVR